MNRWNRTKINAAIKLLEESKNKSHQNSGSEANRFIPATYKQPLWAPLQRQEQPVNQAQSVNYGVYQITALYGGLCWRFSRRRPDERNRKQNNNHHILTANSRNGGETINKTPSLFFAKTLHAMEKLLNQTAYHSDNLILKLAGAWRNWY